MVFKLVNGLTNGRLLVSHKHIDADETADLN